MELSVSEARARLPEVLDRIADGEEVTITRHGRPAAIVVRPDTLRTRRAEETFTHARAIATMMESARTRPLGGASMSPERGDELIEAIRRDRDGR